jgi:diaminopimelate dehydrogenase
MSEKIKIAINGYGNIGRGVEKAIAQNDDMELCAIFTRRDPDSIQTKSPHVKVYHVDDAPSFQDKIDVMILCGGSATDLPEIGPQFAKMFNTIDSFDTHAKIPQYFQEMDAAAKANDHLSIISVGWDPGTFSLNRLFGQAFLPQGTTHTFWGKGVSQGHSDAVRRVAGVKNAIQYTIPEKSAMEAARKGIDTELTPRQKHTRECFVVAEEGADLARIEHDIKTMPNYFADYDTTVHFITEEELKKNHSRMPHGGCVIRSGHTGENHHMIEYTIELDSNPEFTASILVCYARAAYRLSKEGQFGAKTVFDIAPAYLSALSKEELLKTLL